MRFFSLCLLSLIMALPLSGQEDEGALVNSIEITGPHKVDKDFILARILTKLKEPTDWNKLNEDQIRLNRLNGIQHTVIEIDTLPDESLNIRYDIVGQKTIKPQVGLGFIDDSYWYQLGAAEYNLGRKNQTLLGYFLSQDGRPNGKLYYENSNYKGKQWGFWANAFHNASFEPLFFDSGRVDYRYDLTGLGLGGINYFGLLDKLSYSVTFFNEAYNKINLSSENTDGPDNISLRKLLFSVSYLHDKLKYDFFYRSGFQHQLLIQNVQTFGEELPFFSIAYEGRHFIRPNPKTNIAGQLRLAVSTNNDTPFAPFVLDSNYNLRGVGNRVDRATAQLVLNLEIRQTIYRHHLLAIQMVAFSDTGSWRPPGENITSVFKAGNLRSFFGGGVRLVLTKVYDSVIRLDYGIDILNIKEQGFVLGFGQFF